ncbi:MAG TPA: hypothetical protein VFX48_03085, partial [Saprospiraceae bacterium]|nr:hypothetical protein [Saprospiraceae bacterium]
QVIPNGVRKLFYVGSKMRHHLQDRVLPLVGMTKAGPKGGKMHGSLLHMSGFSWYGHCGREDKLEIVRKAPIIFVCKEAIIELEYRKLTGLNRFINHFEEPVKGFTEVRDGLFNWDNAPQANIRECIA